MPIKIQAAKAVAFQEHPVLDFVLVEPGKFDVTAKDLNVPSNFVKENRFLLDAYCLALLNIVCSIPQSDMTSFIDYQCSQLQVPVSWLNSLEQLIEENCELLESSKVKFRIQKLIICINDKLNDLKRKKTRLKSNLVNLDLIDNEDNLLFRSYNDENNNGIQVMLPGEYVSRTSVPENILGPTCYHLVINAGIYGIRRCIPDRDLRIPIDVEATGSYNKAYLGDTFYGKLALVIPWETCRIK